MQLLQRDERSSLRYLASIRSGSITLHSNLCDLWEHSTLDDDHRLQVDTSHCYVPLLSFGGAYDAAMLCSG